MVFATIDCMLFIYWLLREVETVGESRVAKRALGGVTQAANAASSFGNIVPSAFQE